MNDKPQAPSLAQHPLLVGKTNAPNFTANTPWLNTQQPYNIADFKGHPVILDFWTLGCINCIHIQPDLKKLEQAYPNLVIVGVHSAKFSGERTSEKILKASKRYDISHPIVNDSTMALWKAYGVRAWPTLVVITPDGKQVAKVEGEGHYQELDSLLGIITKAYANQPYYKTDKFAFAYKPDQNPTTGLNFAAKLLTDSATNTLYISDSNNNRIVATTPTGKIIFTVGTGTPGFADGTFATAQFKRPMGMALQGNLLYVADRENHAIRVIDLSKKTVKTLLGLGQQAPSRMKSIKQPGRLSSPWDLALLPNGNLGIAMAGFHQLWQYNFSTQTATQLAGSGREDIFDAPAAEAQLAQPTAMVSVGNAVYFIDAETSALRVLENDKVKTLVGKGLFTFGDKDGPATTALLQHPQGIAYLNSKLYIADTYNDKIKVFDLKTNTLSTLKGLENTKLNNPADVKILGNTLYIADTDNSRILVYDLTKSTVSPLNIN